MRSAIGRPLMEAHGVGKADLEKIVIARGHLLENVGETATLAVSISGMAPKVLAAEDKSLKRPHRPERNDGEESIILADNALARDGFELGVVTQQATAVRFVVCQQRKSVSRCGSSGTCSVAQYLTMRMRCLAPIMAPQFSKIWTWVNLRRRAELRVFRHHASTTRSMSASPCTPVLRLWSG